MYRLRGIRALCLWHVSAKVVQVLICVGLMLLAFSAPKPVFAQEKVIHPAFIKLKTHYADAWSRGEEDARKKRNPIDVYNRFRRGIGNIRKGLLSETVSFAWYLPPEVAVYYYSHEAKRLYKSEEEVNTLRDNLLSINAHLIDTIYFLGVISVLPSFDLDGKIVRHADPSDLRDVRVVLKVGNRIYHPQQQPGNIMQRQGQENYTVFIPNFQSITVDRSATFSSSSGSSLFGSYSGRNVWGNYSAYESSFGYGRFSETETITSYYLERVENSYKWYQGYFSVAFSLFDKNGEPIITADDKEITLIVIYGRNERHATYKLEDLINPLGSQKIGRQEKEECMRYSKYMSKYSIALRHFQNENYDECLNLCALLEKEFPDIKRDTLLLKCAALIHKDPKTAVSTLRDIAKIHFETDHQALNYLAFCVIEALEYSDATPTDYSLAIEIAKQAVSLSENNAFYLYTLGKAYYRFGERQEAIRHLEKSAEILRHNEKIFSETISEIEKLIEEIKNL